MKFDIDMPWRPVSEATAASAWTLSGFVAGGLAWTQSIPVPYMVACAWCVLAALYRWRQAIMVWRRKWKLSGHSLSLISPRLLAEKTRCRPDSLWMGFGFDWLTEHTQRVMDARKAPSHLLRLPWLLRPFFPSDNDAIGEHYIHGIGEHESDVYVPLRHLEGHVMTFGTTGAGKTRKMQIAIDQAIAAGDCVIVVDPKGDKDLEEGIRHACALADREHDYLYFHPAYPDRCVRIDPLKNWSRATEIASRISALIPSETGSDAFVAFAWRAINVIVQALVYVRRRPNLKLIKQYVEAGPDALLFDVLSQYVAEARPGLASKLDAYRAQARNALGRRETDPKRIEIAALILLYRGESRVGGQRETIDSLINAYEHSRDHYSRMLASLLPVLEMLTSGDIGDLLSPDYGDLNDARPITDMAKVINSCAVVYIGLDSLSDQTVGSAFASILWADMGAVAGARYNYGIDHDRPIRLFIDEAVESINDPLISLLNKGRGAGFTLYLYSQTYPDFAAKLGSEAKARMVLGNCNNLFALRVKDAETQQFCVETFGLTSVNTVTTTQGINAGDRDITTFSGNVGERQVEDNKAELFPAYMLGMLPNLEYVAAVSGGRIIKGRLPILDYRTDPAPCVASETEAA